MIIYVGAGGGADDWLTDEIGIVSPIDVGGDVSMSHVMMLRSWMSLSVPPCHDMFRCMSQRMGAQVQQIELSLAEASRKCLGGVPLP